MDLILSYHIKRLETKEGGGSSSCRLEFAIQCWMLGRNCIWWISLSKSAEQHFIILRSTLRCLPMPLSCPSCNVSISNLVRNILSFIEVRNRTNENSDHFWYLYRVIQMCLGGKNLIGQECTKELACSEASKMHYCGQKPGSMANKQHQFSVGIRTCCRPLIRLVCWNFSNTIMWWMQKHNMFPLQSSQIGSATKTWKLAIPFDSQINCCLAHVNVEVCSFKYFGGGLF